MGGSISVKSNLLRNSALLDRLLQKPLRRSNIPLFTQVKVNRLPLYIDPAVEVDPFSFKLDVSFVDAPRRAHCSSKAPPPFFEFRYIPSHPPHDSRMDHVHVAPC